MEFTRADAPTRPRPRRRDPAHQLHPRIAATPRRRRIRLTQTSQETLLGLPLRTRHGTPPANVGAQTHPLFPDLGKASLGVSNANATPTRRTQPQPRTAQTRPGLPHAPRGTRRQIRRTRREVRHLHMDIYYRPMLPITPASTTNKWNCPPTPCRNASPPSDSPTPTPPCATSPH